MPWMSTVSKGATAQELALLASARAGDEGAYGQLVEPHRPELHAHCYRMLGSVHDAEDALQDTLLRAWRGLARFEGRSSPRNWLYRIATNVCFDVSARRPKRVLPIHHVPGAPEHEEPGRPLAESVWVEPYPDRALGLHDGFAAPDARYELRESIELAFVAALQYLPARQRAVLILREVLGFSAAEIGAQLEMTPASVNSALQRARKTIDDRLPVQSQQATVRSLGDERTRALVARYMDAMEHDDVDAVLALLTEDAAWSMPPLCSWYQGRAVVASFLAEYPLTLRWRHLPTVASGQVAVGSYVWREERGVFVAEALDVLTLEDGRIAQITAFLRGAIFPSFGLPETFPV
jgi:RNA polymerase sigma-70 factor (ECF subfamily)